MNRITTDGELEAARLAGKINASIHKEVRKSIAPGITGVELEILARQIMHQSGASPAFEQWTDFPSAICVSINDAVGHGIPSNIPFRSGDLVKVDVGVCYDGWHSDAAATYPVGKVSDEAERLMSATSSALASGIAATAPHVKVSDVSFAMHEVVKKAGYDCVRHAFGHGIGTSLHEDPQIANFGPPAMGRRLQEGMLVALEPIVTAGLRYTRKLNDGWTTVTVDGSLAAHFEHTVLVTSLGPEILTMAEEEQSFADGLRRAQEVHGESLATRTFPQIGEIRLRAMKRGDEADLLNLAHLTMDPILMEAWGRRVGRNEICGGRDTRTLVAEKFDGSVIGFLTYRMQDTLHVNTLVIHPECQRSGLGHWLMDTVQDYAKKRELVVTLWVQVNNPQALAFYHKRGFVVTGEPYFNTLAMERACG